MTKPIADPEALAIVPEPPVDVTAALAAVMGDLGGIEKLTPEERRRRGLGGGDAGARGITYAYRGIDQIAAACQPLFAKYGVVIVPKVVAYEVKDILVNNNPWTDTFVHVDWTISGPNGTGLMASTVGWGRDDSDKGMNKATTSAYKNLLLRLLAIGDPDDDGDNSHVEADRRAEPVEPAPTPVQVLWARVKAAAGTPVAEELKGLAAQNNVKLTEASLAKDEAWFDLVAATLNEADKAQSTEEHDG